MNQDMEATIRAVKLALSAKSNNEDKRDPVVIAPKAYEYKASITIRRHFTRPDAEARTVGTPGYVPIPKPPPPTPHCTPAQPTKLGKQMQDYMDQQANSAYRGPPFKVPPSVFVRPMPKARVDLSVHP